jgi:hypothetical protein
LFVKWTASGSNRALLGSACDRHDGQHCREIGIRVALGPTRERVLRPVLGESLRLALAALIVGFAAQALTRHISSMLFGVTRMDPVIAGGLGAALGCRFAGQLCAGGAQGRARRSHGDC